MFPSILQTGKINQGNIALKRVVESIANGDSHVPFRDSKLTMLLQVNFFVSDSHDSPVLLFSLFFLCMSMLMSNIPMFLLFLGFF